MPDLFSTTSDRYGFSRYSVTVHTPDDLTKTPFRVQFNTPAFGGGGDSWGGLSVTLTDELQHLHNAVMQTLRGAITFNGDGVHHPHVTIFQSATSRESQKGYEFGSQIDFGTGFDVASIELVGRLGPARGGTRTIIESFPFANS